MTRPWLVAALCLLAVGLSPVHAQTATSKGTVTIFTDGFAYPNGRISRALTELSVEFDKSSTVRLLPIMGYGGGANVRDLLRFHGADFAIINSDVFGSAAIMKAYPDAHTKLRYVTLLTSQKAFLLARKDITAINHLEGKNVAVIGPEAVALVTATNIFALSKVKTSLVLAHGSNASELVAQSDAIFFLQDDAARLPANAARLGGFHLVPIPSNTAISAVYRPARIDASEAAPFASGDAIATVKVDTLLASFDWSPGQGRYADVTQFIERFFEVLPALRSAHLSSIWRESDVQANVPGWQRHVLAEEARKSVPATTAKDQVPAETLFTTATETIGEKEQLRMSIVARPPLTGEGLPGSGLVAELAAAAIEQMEWPGARDIARRWDRDGAAQIKDILGKKAPTLGLPWEKPACDHPEHLNADSAALCDGAMASEPLIKLVVTLFTGANSDFEFKSEGSMIGRTLCLPADRNLTDLSEQGRTWVAQGKVTLVRPPTLIDCVDLVQRKDADAILVNELEGKFTINRLGLTDAFHMAELPVTFQDVHIILPKDAPKADELLAALNKGIAKLKADPRYSQIVTKHLSSLDPGVAPK